MAEDEEASTSQTVTYTELLAEPLENCPEMASVMEPDCPPEICPTPQVEENSFEIDKAVHHFKVPTLPFMSTIMTLEDGCRNDVSACIKCIENIFKTGLFHVLLYFVARNTNLDAYQVGRLRDLVSHNHSHRILALCYQKMK